MHVLEQWNLIKKSFYHIKYNLYPFMGNDKYKLDIFWKFEGLDYGKIRNFEKFGIWVLEKNWLYIYI